jgi:hypothetical protein
MPRPPLNFCEKITRLPLDQLDTRNRRTEQSVKEQCSFFYYK